ncbi:hypothetical protein [Flavobacterium ammonificans]|uniref:DUF1566 domain-containing protein n=1 Tax=Flavobacterium ammonificans TaxID=1751056 RepID=A0ABN6KW97_9FLAO|nr:hypothetical protein [Flavobacterium ammonificans]BDB53214.1 hypothetical protein GENT11_15260 [Flavobacterium ammonificans]
MKKTLLFLAFILSTFSFAQTNGITYQAVIYSANGESVPGINNANAPLANRKICLQFSIVDDFSQTEYQEKVIVTTDDYGMVNLIIGTGIQTGGYANSFESIVWNSAKKYLKVSLDQSGNCNSFDEISNQVLSYVPFALAANSATSVSGIVGIANGGTNASTVLGAKTNLQLQNVDNTADLNKPISTLTQLALDSKVDKVVGKNLSTEDFTTAEKTKLASLGGAQDLSLFAPLLSPSLSGIPTAPTATFGTNSTQLATTAFVANALNNSVGGSFVDLNTNQTIGGNKTFNSDIIANGLIIGKGKGQNNYNTVFGAGALNSSNANGTRNTAIGYLALTQYAGTTFDNNTGVGYFNMIGLTTGYGNTSIGAETMFNVGTASNNTGIGNQSLINAAGDNNVGVGARSGDGLTTGTNNTFIGTQARTTSAGATITNATALGYGAVVTENNTIQLGNSSITSVKTSGSVLAFGFKTPTGTSTQYLMADGSVSSSTLSNYLPLSGGNMTGQLSIGTNSPESSAVLNVASTTQGFLPPRMNKDQRNGINNPLAGLIVWCKNCGENGELQVYNGTNWTNFIGGATSEPLVVGSSYKGGKIAYIFQSGDPGYVAGEFHGIIASNSDLSNGIRWGQGNDGLSTTYDCVNRHSASGFALPCAIGAGRSNTSLIIASNTESSPTDYAALICSNYSVVSNGVTYNDWFLPSKDEMLKLYQNKNLIGGLFYDSTNASSKSNWYWTSSGDVFQDRATDVNSSNANNSRSFRGSLLSVRAVMYF